MGVRKGCAPPSVSAPPRSHTLSLCTHAGAHCHLSPAPFCTPALVRPPFRLPATLPGLRTAVLAHPPPCTHAGAHHHPFAPPLWCTHLLFACGSPAWVAPRLARMPFARVPPVLLCPQHARKGRGCAGRAGCVNRGWPWGSPGGGDCGWACVRGGGGNQGAGLA